MSMQKAQHRQRHIQSQVARADRAHPTQKPEETMPAGASE
jgi:hypothetical protein